MMAEDNAPDLKQVAEEQLLSFCRSGDAVATLNLISEWKDGKLNLNLDVRGMHGWRPLHFASYFGHLNIVELLIKFAADINVQNDTGDTPLHKAAYTGREEVVLLLLSKNADVFVKNSEGQTPHEITQSDDIKKLLKAAADTDMRKKNSLLLHASREGDIQTIENLLKSDNSPDINCVDSLGNTALHCAAYRGKKEAAVLLLQNGINPSIKNLRGQCAIDLAMNVPMKQILGVQPVKHLQKIAVRFEGLLLRKSRFLGWREVWTILEKGVMSFFNSRADSTTGTKRKGYKYLDGARVIMDSIDMGAFTVIYSDNTRQRFSVCDLDHQQVDRQKWVNSIREHIEFSSHYLKQGFSDSDDDDEASIPTGTMQDKLQTAQAHLQLFQKNAESFKTLFDEHYGLESVSSGNSYFYSETSFVVIYNNLEQLLDSSRKVSSTLSHCFSLFAQQEEIRMLQLKEQNERCRVLQDALHALAQEHHELEKSMASPFQSPPNSPHYLDTDCDEFFDAFEGESVVSHGHNRDDTVSVSHTIVDSEATACFASFSMSSEESLKPLPTKWGRSILPVQQFSRNDFSVWSILKQCIGKELSKITMPVVFNEPLSFLQRLCENIEYSHLLDKANNCNDPVKRMEYVSAFAVACISSNWERLGKPFNPLLGETYELIRDDLDFRIFAEQVSHHPPVTAFHADSSNFEFTGAIHPKLKLWARSVEVKPEGTLVLKLLKHNEMYTWKGVTSCIHNIIVGKLWMEQCGVMEIVCHSNGLTAELNFKPAGWYSKDLNCVEGFIFDEKRTKLSFLYGKWCSFIKKADVDFYEEYLQLKEQKLAQSRNRSRASSPLIDSSENIQASADPDNENAVKIEENTLGKPIQLWEADKRPEWSSEYYNFTYFAMALNEVNNVMKIQLPPTDSRLRPDIRKLEEGDVDGAAFEKNRLEEKQREVRKIRKKEKTEWQPVWFESKSHPYAKEEYWSYKGGYWDRDYKSCPDIF